MWQCSWPFLPGKLSVQEGFMTKTWLSEKYLIGAVLAAGISAALAWATPDSNFTLTPLQRSSTNDRIDIKTKPHQLLLLACRHACHCCKAAAGAVPVGWSSSLLCPAALWQIKYLAAAVAAEGETAEKEPEVAANAVAGHALNEF